ncbi:MAG: threonine/serine exporter family protein [Dermatophilaceae bacterium]
MQHWLAHRGIAAFFTQAAGGAIPTGVAVALLAGLSVVGAAQDAIDGYYVTAGARVFEVLVLTLGIVVGIGAVLAIARRSGVSMQFTADTPLSANTVVQVLAALAAGVPVTGGRQPSEGPGPGAEHGRHRAVAAGLAVYRGLFEIVQRSPGTGLSTGLTTLLGAAGVGMGLAAGVSLGTFLARPMRAELDRGQRRALRRSAGDARE